MNLGFHNVGRFCAGIALHKRKCEINLDSITFFSPFALVYLGMYLRHHYALSRSFTVQLPAAAAARAYLARQRFWERFNFREEDVKRENLQRITTSTSMNDIVDIEVHDYIGEEIGDKVRDLLIFNGCYRAGQVGVMVAELVDNFAQHSRRGLAAMALQYYPRLGTLRLAVGDCGVGIRQSLSKNPEHSWLEKNPEHSWLEKQPHHVAAMEALKPGVTGKIHGQGGIGFVDVVDGVDDLGGQLLLATGDEYITVRQGRARYGNMFHELPGVQIELFLPVGRF